MTIDYFVIDLLLYRRCLSGDVNVRGCRPTVLDCRWAAVLLRRSHKCDRTAQRRKESSDDTYAYYVSRKVVNCEVFHSFIHSFILTQAFYMILYVFNFSVYVIIIIKINDKGPKPLTCHNKNIKSQICHETLG